LIEFIGEVNDQQKQDVLGGARALLFPIQWPEPFGLVMIEALACGTPVIAYPQGSVPEILQDGRTGYLVSHVEEAVSAVKKISQIDRRECREVFERRFSVKRAAADYIRQYEVVLQSEAENVGVT
jgi:glycosyltransferase involved in cell wall biosynthesis